MCFRPGGAPADLVSSALTSAWPSPLGARVPVLPLALGLSSFSLGVISHQGKDPPPDLLTLVFQVGVRRAVSTPARWLPMESSRAVPRKVRPWSRCCVETSPLGPESLCPGHCRLEQSRPLLPWWTWPHVMWGAPQRCGRAALCAALRPAPRVQKQRPLSPSLADRLPFLPGGLQGRTGACGQPPCLRPARPVGSQV